jgi:hypothetical protein
VARASRSTVGRAAVATAAALVAACATATAGGDPGPWPDFRVAALWPTFAAVPAPESGAGGARSWNGAFSRCLASPDVPTDYACEYRDARGRLGYVCLAAREPAAPITPSSIDARVAPDDPTYAAAAPPGVCDSALAYALSLG